MKQWQCMVCGYIYNEEQGMPEDGIPPGTPWNDVPAVSYTHLTLPTSDLV